VVTFQTNLFDQPEVFTERWNGNATRDRIAWANNTACQRPAASFCTGPERIHICREGIAGEKQTGDRTSSAAGEMPVRRGRKAARTRLLRGGSGKHAQALTEVDALQCELPEKKSLSGLFPGIPAANRSKHHQPMQSGVPPFTIRV